MVNEDVKKNIFCLSVQSPGESVLGTPTKIETEVYVACKNLVDAVNWYDEAFPDHTITNINKLDYEIYVLKEIGEN